MFDDGTCNLLRRFTESPPKDETYWYGPWTTIITSLFPVSKGGKGYFVSPLCRTPEGRRVPYHAFEVSQFTESRPRHWRPVLIVAVMRSQDWQAGVPSLETEINRLIDTAFSGTDRGTAISKVYWIGVLGPHWRYGVKEVNGGELKPLIDWHDTTHDQASYDDFQKLTALIEQM